MSRVSRRAFLKGIGATGAVFLIGGFPLRGRASERIRIGHLAPRAGPYAQPGRYAAGGARMAGEEVARTARMFGKEFELILEEANTPEEAEKKAEGLAKAGVVALVGGIETASCLMIGEVAKRYGILYFNTGSKDEGLRGERCHRYLFHVEASSAMYVDAISTWLLRKAKRTRWAFVTAETEESLTLYRLARTFLTEQGGVEVGH